MQTSMRLRTALVAVVALFLTTAVRAQVMDQVPADALMVIKVNNLDTTSQQFAKWAQDVGLAALNPQLADPLKSLQQQMGINEGLATNGEMAIAMLDPEKYGGGDAPPFVM